MAKRTQEAYHFAPTGVPVDVLEERTIPYLGSQEDVHAFLANFVSECLDKRLEPQATPVGIARFDRRYCVRLAHIFLGRRENLAHGVRGWNRPGGIDEHIAKKWSIDEKSSTKRMATFFALVLLNALTTIEAASENEDLPEQWEGPLQMQIDNATRDLIGLPELDEFGNPITVTELTHNTDEDDEKAYRDALG